MNSTNQRPDQPAMHARLTRRRTIGLLGASLGAAAVPLRGTLGQDDAADSTPDVSIESNTVGEMPTTGGLRPGPVGQQPPAASTAATAPASIYVERAQIDAEIEEMDIVDGVMENPTGPWVVSWYRQTAMLGELGNVVLAGHVDYWDVGPSVFYTVGDLTEGDVIQLTGEDDAVFAYTVQWNETFDLNQLTSGTITEIVGSTEERAVTLITCGGEFDYETGEYLSRTVVRGLLTPDEGTPGA